MKRATLIRKQTVKMKQEKIIRIQTDDYAIFLSIDSLNLIVFNLVPGILLVF